MDPSLNLVDALLAGIVLLGVWSAWHRGFLLAAQDLLVLVLSVVLAFAGYRYAATLLERHTELGVWARPISFLATYLAARILLGLLGRHLMEAVPRQAHGHVSNRVLGVLPGFINGLINAAIVALLLLAVPLFDGLTVKARESVLANRLSGPAEWMESKLAPIFQEAAHRTLNRLTVQPGSTERIALPFSVQNPKVRPDLEARMLEMVNAERARQGLPPLKADPEVAKVARAHSRDMFARSYFSHLTPEGKNPFDRLRGEGVRFLTAGENLALAQTLTGAHEGLMNSPGHRANILRPSFGRVGIGVLDGGRYGLMVTQNFRN